MDVDKPFLEAVVTAVDTAVEQTLAEVPQGLNGWAHRQLMDHMKLLVGAYLFESSSYYENVELLAPALTLASTLHDLQTPNGLFYGGDNVSSPPDSAFTVNDVCDTIEVICRAESLGSTPTLNRVKEALEVIADAAEPALVAGGIHTPNHRWELSAALSRLYRRRPSPQLYDRILEWLAEGIDLNADGSYSERSANYAAHVSNPSLILIGDVLQRTDLHEVVEANLTSTLELILPDRMVETVHSRRQDQNDAFSMSPYLLAYRRFAIERQRGDFSWAAEQALAAGLDGASTIITELLLNPGLSQKLPACEAPETHRRSLWPDSKLAVDARPERTIVVYGGSDYAQAGRVRSGLANNPTFMRLFAGEAVLDAVRLSRTFFGLGPFRASGFTVREGGESYALSEAVGASYYQPLAESERSTKGQYQLEDEGRFYAAMSFSRRERDRIQLETEIVVTPTDAGAHIDIDMTGPKAPWVLELTFRGDGTFLGGLPLSSRDVHFVDGSGVYRIGETELVVTSDAARNQAVAPGYSPGEDYEFLGATDATTGRHAYLTGNSPGRFSIDVSVRGHSGTEENRG
ncbi:hypothetical protein MB46_18905 [Arthrobacter alpinus]|nr:hypothetical protein MB46_18905 [Arthrobacter alpinus]